MSPLAFTDEQIKMLVAGAKPLHPDDRSTFLAEVVAALPAGSTIGNASIREAIAKAQRNAARRVAVGFKQIPRGARFGRLTRQSSRAVASAVWTTLEWPSAI
jgi:hypothetical protein